MFLTFLAPLYRILLFVAIYDQFGRFCFLHSCYPLYFLLPRYSQEQMFDIAADVSRYKEFVPWCNDSAVIRQIPPNSFEVRLGVGFPPLSETYHSTVTLRKPGHVRVSVCVLVIPVCSRGIHTWISDSSFRSIVVDTSHLCFGCR